MRCLILLLSIAGALSSPVGKTTDGPTYITLHCEYKYVQHFSYANFYTCVGQNVTVTDKNTVVKAVTGTHQSGKGDRDVQAIMFNGQTGVNFVPQFDLMNVFPNFVALTIEGAPIKYLSPKNFMNKQQFKFIHLDNNEIGAVAKKTFYNMTQIEWISLGANRIRTLNDDLLRGLTTLTYFSASRNQIEVLGSSIFRDNTKLRTIHMYENKIRMVGWKLVRLMTDLKFATFNGNVCTNIHLQNDSDISDKLTQEFSTKCAVNCQRTNSAADKRIEELNREQEKLSQQSLKNKNQKQSLKVDCNDKDY